MLYIHEPLKATRYYAEDKYEYKDSVWCTVEFGHNRRLSVGVCYRSPNSTQENNEKLFEILDNIMLTTRTTRQPNISLITRKICPQSNALHLK